MRFSSLSRALLSLGLAGFWAVSAAAQSAEYVLGPQDIFSITIFGPGGVSER